MRASGKAEPATAVAVIATTGIKTKTNANA
jgi:hypothetical protein